MLWTFIIAFPFMVLAGVVAHKTLPPDVYWWLGSVPGPIIFVLVHAVRVWWSRRRAQGQ